MAIIIFDVIIACHTNSAVVAYDLEIPKLLQIKQLCLHHKYCLKIELILLFLFQIMPQLLHYLKIDNSQTSMDWGTLLVYTCSNNCLEYDNDNSSNAGYMKEFLWRQDYSTTEN